MLSLILSDACVPIAVIYLVIMAPLSSAPLRRRTTRAVAALYAVWMAYTWRAKNQPGDWGPRALSELLRFLFDLVFRVSGIKSEAVMSPEAQAQEKCIVTVSPHGAFAIGHVFLSMPKLRLEPRFAHFRGRAGAASVLFTVPILRECLLSLGVREATKATMDALIRDGCSIALNTGGIWEQVHTDDAQEQLVAPTPRCPALLVDVTSNPVADALILLPDPCRLVPARSTSSATLASSGSRSATACRLFRHTPLARGSSCQRTPAC